MLKLVSQKSLISLFDPGSCLKLLVGTPIIITFFFIIFPYFCKSYWFVNPHLEATFTTINTLFL